MVLFTFFDVIIDPLALRGDQWFLGQIYGYSDEALYFGIPLANFSGWAVVGLVSLFVYRWLERGLFKDESVPQEVVRRELFLGIGLYYGVLAFNLVLTFWIGEVFIGIVGCFIFTPLTAVLLVTLCRGETFSRAHEGLTL